MKNITFLLSAFLIFSFIACQNNEEINNNKDKLPVVKDVDANVRDNDGKTPLDYAQTKDVKQLLISHGAKSCKDLK